MRIEQVDIKTAFLNKNPEENIWVMSPRISSEKLPRKYKLKEATYEFVHAFLRWQKNCSGELLAIGFVQLPSAPCVLRNVNGGQLLFTLIYVDNLLIILMTKERSELVILMLEI